MSVPDFQSIMLPILQILSDGNEHTFKEISDELIAGFGLTEDDLKELLPSGRQTKFANRYSWARIYLKEAGLIELVAPKTLRLTSDGIEVLGLNLSRIDIKF